MTHHWMNHQNFSSWLADIVRSDIALDKQKGCKLANHPDIMLELQREKAASTQLVLLKEQLSNIYSNITITGRRSLTNCLFGPRSDPDMFSGPGGSCTFMRLHSHKGSRHASVNHQLQNDKCNFVQQECGDGLKGKASKQSAEISAVSVITFNAAWPQEELWSSDFGWAAFHICYCARLGWELESCRRK